MGKLRTAQHCFMLRRRRRHPILGSSPILARTWGVTRRRACRQGRMGDRRSPTLARTPGTIRRPAPRSRLTLGSRLILGHTGGTTRPRAPCPDHTPASSRLQAGCLRRPPGRGRHGFLRPEVPILARGRQAEQRRLPRRRRKVVTLGLLVRVARSSGGSASASSKRSRARCLYASIRRSGWCVMQGCEAL